MDDGSGNHLRHDPARRRAVARRTLNIEEKLDDRQPAGAAGRRRDRGRLPDLLARRLRGGAAHRRARSRARPSAAWPARSPRDIDRAWEARAGAPSARASTPSSPPPTSTSSTSCARAASRSLEIAGAMVARAQGLRATTSSSRRGRHALRPRLPRTEMLEAAIEAGATTLNIPDTVGYTTPEEFGELIADIRAQRARHRQARSSRSTATTTSGMAVANTLAAVEGGARQVECTINGIGERAGNASLEEIVMALRTRQRLLRRSTPASTRRRSTRPAAWSATTPACSCSRTRRSSAPTPSPTSRASTRTACSRSARPTRSWTPQSIGLVDSKLVLGKHSGRHAFRERLAELGYDLCRRRAGRRPSRRFKEMADKKRTSPTATWRRSSPTRCARRSRSTTSSRCRSPCGRPHHPDGDGQSDRARGPGDGRRRARRRPGRRRLQGDQPPRSACPAR